MTVALERHTQTGLTSANTLDAGASAVSRPFQVVKDIVNASADRCVAFFMNRSFNHGFESQQSLTHSIFYHTFIHWL